MYLKPCKYFCKGTDAVKPREGVKTVFCGTVTFFVLYLVELILLAERVWNNISHVIL